MFSLIKLIRLLSVQTMIKIVQSIDLIEPHSYGTSKNLASQKEEIKVKQYNKTIQKMINFDDVLRNPIDYKLLIIYTEY